MSNESISKISKISQSVDQVKKPVQEPNKEHFDALISEDTADKKASTSTQMVEQSRPKTLMEEVRDLNYKVDQVKRSTPEDLVAQAKDIINQINGLKEKISTPDVKIKTSARKLLRSKLSHIDESLKIALTKAGVEYTPPEQRASLATPIERFLGFLTHSEAQMDRLAAEVQTMHLNKEELSPANMLAVQIKVTHVQQELEFFTNLLNKALESTKTIMNVQV